MFKVISLKNPSCTVCVCVHAHMDSKYCQSLCMYNNLVYVINVLHDSYTGTDTAVVERRSLRMPISLELEFMLSSSGR